MSKTFSKTIALENLNKTAHSLVFTSYYLLTQCS